MKQHMLVIDDLREPLELLRLLLEQAFPEAVIRTAQGGCAGWEAALQEPPDLVLLDAKMPDLDGFEVCRRIKSHPSTSQTLVLMVSGEYIRPPDRISGWESGADGYLCKPFQSAELVGQVKALLRVAADRRQLARAEALEPEKREAQDRLRRQNETKFRMLFDRSPEAILVYDNEGRVLDANAAAALLFGASREELAGSRVGSLLGGEAGEGGIGDLPARLASDPTAREQAAEVTVRLKGRRKTLDLLARRIDFGGQEAFLLLLRDASGRRRVDEALRHVAQGVSASTGFPFFYALVECLAEVLEADHVLLAEVNPSDPEDLVTLAVVSSGQIADNFHFHVRGTPFEKLADAQGILRDDDSARMDAHPAFANWKTRCFIGVSLMDGDGHGIGALAAMYRAPLTDAETAENLLRLFAGRAASELDRQRAVERLWESEQRYRSLTDDVLNTLAMGTIILDQRGRVVWVNRAIETYFRLERETLIGQEKSRLLSLLRPLADPPGALEEAARKARGRDGISRRLIFRIPGGQGREDRWVEHWSQPIRSGLYMGGRIEYYSDITSRHVAEAERRLLSQAIEQAGEAMTILDLEGAMRYVNPAFEAMTGYGRNDALGQPHKLLRSKRDETTFRQMWEEARAGRGWSGRLFLTRRNGQAFEAEGTLSPMRDSAGQVVSYVASARDVTREIEWEAQLRQAQKMESIGQLAGGIAHDFNNLLTSILGFSRLIRESIDEDHTLREDIEEVIRSGERAAKLTRQLLTLGRKQMVTMHPLDLNHVVFDTDTLLRRTLGEHLELVFLPGDNLGAVEADVGLLEQVIMNLAINARDAMPDGGKLIIETERVALDEVYCATRVDLAPGDVVRLSVRDNGTGMPPEVLEHACEPFFTTKGKQQGSGLGLSTVYGIVKQCGGHLEIRSRLGEGTEVVIHFPVSRADIEPETETKKYALVGGSETVLVVEDEGTVRNLTVRLLRSLGYKTLEARHGGEALPFFEKGAPRVDLLLSDVVMPHIGGFELVRKLRKKGVDVKVLFTSGFTGETRGSKMPDGIREPLLEKPYTREALAKTVRLLLDGDKGATGKDAGRS